MRIKEIIVENLQENVEIHQFDTIYGGGKILFTYQSDTNGVVRTYILDYVTKNGQSKFKYEYKNSIKKWYDPTHPIPAGELWHENTTQIEMITKFMDSVITDVV